MTKNISPLISIVIITYNSSKTLENTLQSIKEQSYPKHKIETLVIDGGSRDNTVEIAKKYNCLIIKKPNTDIVLRKFLGFKEAKGEYLVYLDSDEYFDSKDALYKRSKIFQINPEVKCIISQGCKSPEKSSFINDYINDFGDPFSFYLYREAKNSFHLIETWRKKYKILKQDQNCIVFDIVNTNHSSLIELWAGGNTIDLKYVKAKFPILKNDSSKLALVYYLIKDRGKLLAITKNDVIIHNSASSLKDYLRKITSRIKNNIFHTNLGNSGFSGREEFEKNKAKKFFFLFYGLLFLPALIDSLYMSFRWGKLSYLMHFPLTLYSVITIVYFFLMKTVGYKPRKISY
jgi:glycosyltransferase involved in cell wall biosynthesis